MSLKKDVNMTPVKTIISDLLQVLGVDEKNLAEEQTSLRDLMDLFGGGDEDAEKIATKESSSKTIPEEMLEPKKQDDTTTPSEINIEESVTFLKEDEKIRVLNRNLQSMMLALIQDKILSAKDVEEITVLKPTIEKEGVTKNLVLGTTPFSEKVEFPLEVTRRTKSLISLVANNEIWKKNMYNTLIEESLENNIPMIIVDDGQLDFILTEYQVKSRDKKEESWKNTLLFLLGFSEGIGYNISLNPICLPKKDDKLEKKILQWNLTLYQLMILLEVNPRSSEASKYKDALYALLKYLTNKEKTFTSLDEFLNWLENVRLEELSSIVEPSLLRNILNKLGMYRQEEWQSVFNGDIIIDIPTFLKELSIKLEQDENVSNNVPLIYFNLKGLGQEQVAKTKKMLFAELIRWGVSHENEHEKMKLMTPFVLLSSKDGDSSGVLSNLLLSSLGYGIQALNDMFLMNRLTIVVDLSPYNLAEELIKNSHFLIIEPSLLDKIPLETMQYFLMKMDLDLDDVLSAWEQISNMFKDSIDEQNAVLLQEQGLKMIVQDFKMSHPVSEFASVTIQELQKYHDETKRLFEPFLNQFKARILKLKLKQKIKELKLEHYKIAFPVDLDIENDVRNILNLDANIRVMVDKKNWQYFPFYHVISDITLKRNLRDAIPILSDDHYKDIKLEIRKTQPITQNILEHVPLENVDPMEYKIPNEIFDKIFSDNGIKKSMIKVNETNDELPYELLQHEPQAIKEGILKSMTSNLAIHSNLLNDWFKQFMESDDFKKLLNETVSRIKKNLEDIKERMKKQDEKIKKLNDLIKKYRMIKQKIIKALEQKVNDYKLYNISEQTHLPAAKKLLQEILEGKKKIEDINSRISEAKSLIDDTMNKKKSLQTDIEQLLHVVKTLKSPDLLIMPGDTWMRFDDESDKISVLDEKIIWLPILPLKITLKSNTTGVMNQNQGMFVLGETPRLVIFCKDCKNAFIAQEYCGDCLEIKCPYHGHECKINI